VSELLLDVVQLFARGDEQAGVSVTQVVEADVAQLGGINNGIQTRWRKLSGLILGSQPTDFRVRNDGGFSGLFRVRAPLDTQLRKTRLAGLASRVEERERPGCRGTFLDRERRKNARQGANRAVGGWSKTALPSTAPSRSVPLECRRRSRR
jgi:hypothetical protein